MTDSIFTKIIKGEIPCHRIYEDDKTIAFLSIHPIQPGHVLVVPKKQTEQFQNLPDEEYVALWVTVKKVAQRLKKILGGKRIGIQVIGLQVPHAHVHIFPFDNIEQYTKIADETAEPDHHNLEQMAKKLAFTDDTIKS
jgi:histidine triad (HIT) family protein